MWEEKKEELYYSHLPLFTLVLCPSCWDWRLSSYFFFLVFFFGFRHDFLRLIPSFSLHLLDFVRFRRWSSHVAPCRHFGRIDCCLRCFSLHVISLQSLVRQGHVDQGKEGTPGWRQGDTHSLSGPVFLTQLKNPMCIFKRSWEYCGFLCRFR